MPRPPNIPLEWLEPLPIVLRIVIPSEYRDHMDHMNVRWYLALYDEAGDEMYKLYGQTLDYYRAYNAGGFDLENHIRYLNEVRIGDKVTIRARLLSRSAKRIHYMMFLVNETRGLLSSTFECVNSHADLTQRRTAPYPDFIAAQIDSLIAQHSQLEWDAPICGSMSS